MSSCAMIIDLFTGLPVKGEEYSFFEQDKAGGLVKLAELLDRLRTEGFLIEDTIDSNVKLAYRSRDCWVVVYSYPAYDPTGVLVGASGAVPVTMGEASVVLWLVEQALKEANSLMVDAQRRAHLKEIQAAMVEGVIYQVDLKYLIYVLLHAAQGLQPIEKGYAESLRFKLITPEMLD